MSKSSYDNIPFIAFFVLLSSIMLYAVIKSEMPYQLYLIGIYFVALIIGLIVSKQIVKIQKRNRIEFQISQISAQIEEKEKIIEKLNERYYQHLTIKKEKLNEELISKENELEEAQNKLRNVFEKRKDEILDAYNNFTNLLEIRDEWLSKYDLNKWVNDWSYLSKITSVYVEYENILVDFDREYKKLNEYFLNYQYIVTERNKKYLEKEKKKYSLFFKHECGKDSLNEDQINSIIINEHNNLVLASAGTGKTTAIIAKIGYLLKKGLIQKNDVLAITFAREAKNEMRYRAERLFKETFEFKTFHKLGRDIIYESESNPPNTSRFASNKRKFEEKLEEFIRNRIGGFSNFSDKLDKQKTLETFVSESIKNTGEVEDIVFLNQLNNYFLFMLKPYQSEFNFDNLGEYYEYIKSIKSQQIFSIKDDNVKSYEECLIANYLYSNGVEYEYEKQYKPFKENKINIDYKPDFYLKEYDIDIEHFGINREGKTASFIDNDKYARAQHMISFSQSPVLFNSS